MKTYIFTLLLLLGFAVNLLAQPCLPNTSSLDFNGFSSAVRISPGAALEITDQITIEAWVYARSFGTSPTVGSIVCKHSWNPGTYGFVMRAGGAGILSFNLGTSMGWQEVTSNANALTLNTWHHVAATYDGTTMGIYINGAPAGSLNFSGSISSNVGLPVRIGALADTNWGMSRYWDGYIDEVRIWHRALTAGELLAGMNDHIDPATAVQLAGYWRFNDTPNAVIQDYSPNNNPGMVLGTTWSTVVPWNNTTPATPVITYSGGQLHASSASTYQWYFGSTLILGATQQNYTPTQYGNYTVLVSGPTGCNSTSAPFNYNTTGIGTAEDSEFGISPNPAQSIVRIHVPAAYSFADLQIINLSGQLEKGLRLTGQTEKNIDLSDLSPGMYFLKLSTSGQNIVKKLMVW